MVWVIWLQLTEACAAGKVGGVRKWGYASLIVLSAGMDDQKMVQHDHDLA